MEPHRTSESGFALGVRNGLSCIATAAVSAWRHATTTAGIMVLDSLFLFMLGVVSATFGTRVIDTLFSIAAVLVPTAAISTDQGISFMSLPSLQPLFLQAAGLVALMAFSALLAFCILEGLAWCLCQDLAGRPQACLSYLARFTRTAGILFPLFILYEALAFFRDFRELSLERMPGLVLWNPSVLVPVMGVLVLYFILVALSALGEGSAFAAVRRAYGVGVKHIAAALPCILPLLLLVALVELASRSLLALGTPGSILAVLLVLAFLAVGRTTLILMVEDIGHA